MAIGFIPGMPSCELDPDLVLLIFLPPLLYGAAFFTSLRDLRANARPIALLSIGVVFATMFAVAFVAHEVIGLGWAESFVLGAIVSPTDAVAPAEIMRRVGAPRRLLTIVEGENLTNDWTALVLYRVAVAAVVTGSFSLVEASWQFVLSGLGGLAVGLAAGWVIRAGALADRRPAHRDHDLHPLGLRRLPPRRAARLLRRDRGCDRRHLHGLAHARADHRADAHPGTSRLGDPHVPAERAAVPAGGAPATDGVLDDVSGHAAAELIGWGLLVSSRGDGVRLLWGFTVVYLLRAIDRRESAARAPAPLAASAS